ncbi:MAG TPA: hypothetical protein PKY50_00150 [Candidatus Competibacter sp.]|nr:hypothetical protein [Candidatus Competibacter sp.]
MVSDRRVFDRLRVQARQARADGQFAQAARLERRAVVLAETLGLVGERTQALLWEGYSLRQAGEDDLALAVLLQAANERAATAGQADVFGALAAIIHIGLERKTAAFCRALLAQGRRYLADIRQPWGALLDFLEGELAFRRGDFAAAWNWHSRAWANRRDEPPRLTAATHLWALCRTAFRRHDLTELERLVERLNELHPTQFLERQLLQRAQLLRWRARRAASSSPPASGFDPIPIELALALLTETAGIENRDTGARCEALRVLALAGRFDEVDAALSRQPLRTDCFESALLLGELALIRTRVRLGLPVVDDDYGEPASDTPAPFSALAVAVALRQAEDHYRTAQHLADAEDERLETSWYGDGLRSRLNMLRCTISLDACL